jgi:hypothetical protein
MPIEESRLWHRRSSIAAEVAGELPPVIHLAEDLDWPRRYGGVMLAPTREPPMLPPSLNRNSHKGLP